MAASPDPVSALDGLREAPMAVLIGCIYSLLADRGLMLSSGGEAALLLSGESTDWRPVGLAAAHALLSTCLSPADPTPRHAHTGAGGGGSVDGQAVDAVAELRSPSWTASRFYRPRSHSIDAISEEPSTASMSLARSTSSPTTSRHLKGAPVTYADGTSLNSSPSNPAHGHPLGHFNIRSCDTAALLNEQVEQDAAAERDKAREEITQLLSQTFAAASPKTPTHVKGSVLATTNMVRELQRWTTKASIKVSAFSVAKSQVNVERWQRAINKVRLSVRHDVRERLKQEKILNPRYNLLSVLLEQRRKSQLTSLVNAEAEKELNKRTQAEMPLRSWQLHPESSVIQMWDGLLTIALIWTLIAVPFRIAFEPLYFECEEGLEALQQCSLGFVVDLIVNFMFILDVCVVFSTGVWVVKKMPALLEAPNQSIFHQTKLQALLKSYTLKLSDKLTVNRTRLPSFVQRGVHNFQTYITEAANKRATAKVTDEDDDMDPSDNPYSDAGMKKGKEILSYHTPTIAAKYIKSYLVIDVVSCVPWEMLLAEGTQGVASSARALKLVRLFRMLRLLRMHKATKVVSRLSKMLPMTFSQLLALSLYAIILVHYLACGFFLIATTYERLGQQTWLSNLDDNWGKEFSLDDSFVQENMLQLYLLSFYWGFTTITTVGYGDIVPYTDAERLYSIFAMYCGIALMSIITGKLTTILAQFVAQRAQLQLQLRQVHQYCNYRNLPPDLKQSVKEFFSVRAAQRAMCNEDQILNELSPPMKAKVVCFIFRDVIESVPFFRGSDDLFLSAILSSMTPILFSPTDVIIQKGQLETAMYVIGKGHAAVLDKRNHVMRHLNPGDFVGEIALFFNTRRSATVLALVFCDTFRMSYEQLVGTLTLFPDAQSRLEQQAEILFVRHIRCYLCNQPGHISIGCKNIGSIAPPASRAKSKSPIRGGRSPLGRENHSDGKPSKRRSLGQFWGSSHLSEWFWGSWSWSREFQEGSMASQLTSRSNSMTDSLKTAAAPLRSSMSRPPRRTSEPVGLRAAVESYRSSVSMPRGRRSVSLEPNSYKPEVGSSGDGGANSRGLVEVNNWSSPAPAWLRTQLDDAQGDPNNKRLPYRDGISKR